MWKRAERTYESTARYYSFYTRFSLVHVGLRKSGKANDKRRKTLLSCIKSKKTYQLMTFPPKIESTHRQKENKHQTLLSSQNHLSGKILTNMWDLPSPALLFTVLHEPGPFIEVTLSKMSICQKYHHQSSSIFSSHRFALRLGNCNKTTYFPKQWARKDMNFSYCYSYFLHHHADLSQKNSPSP